MKILWTLLLLASPALLVGCDMKSDESPELTAFRNDLSDARTELEKNFVSFDNYDARRRADCGRVVFRMVSRAKTVEEQQMLSEELASLLAGSDNFRMFDGHVLAIGSDTLRNYPPAEHGYLIVLANKVDDAQADTAVPSTYPAEYAPLTAGYLLDIVDYPGSVSIYDNKLNQWQWDAFSTWLRTNNKMLVYDTTYRCYHLAGRRVARRIPTTDPTLENPGR